jgi:hypothetical protein
VSGSAIPLMGVIHSGENRAEVSMHEKCNNNNNNNSTYLKLGSSFLRFSIAERHKIAK